MAAAGYDVRLVLPHPCDEMIGGSSTPVRVLGVPAPRSGKARMTVTVRNVYRRALEQPADAIFHLHDADLLPVALALKARGRDVVYDAHEDTPLQMRHQPWIPSPARPLVASAYGVMEQLVARAADGIVAAEPLNAQRFPSEKTVLVRNVPLLDEITPGEVPLAEREPIVTYVGTLTRARGVEEMIRAITQLTDLGAALHLAGPFHPASLEREVMATPGAAQTTLHGYLDRAAVADLLGRTRAGLVTLHPTPKYVEAYPTKLFEYMAAGVPVVASDFPLWREIVEDVGCGLLVDPADPDAIAAAVRTLLTDDRRAAAMGQRGREAVKTTYHWQPEGERLLAFYLDRFGGPRAD